MLEETCQAVNLHEELEDDATMMMHCRDRRRPLLRFDTRCAGDSNAKVCERWTDDGRWTELKERICSVYKCSTRS